MLTYLEAMTSVVRFESLSWLAAQELVDPLRKKGGLPLAESTYSLLFSKGLGFGCLFFHLASSAHQGHYI